MGLEDSSIPQRRGSAANCGINSLQHDGFVREEKLAVPLRLSAARDDGERFTLVQIVLPVGKVNSQAEEVPSQDARHAGADYAWVRGRYMLIIGSPVDVELFLPLWVLH